jgi:hypothetical protein
MSTTLQRAEYSKVGWATTSKKQRGLNLWIAVSKVLHQTFSSPCSPWPGTLWSTNQASLSVDLLISHGKVLLPAITERTCTHNCSFFQCHSQEHVLEKQYSSRGPRSGTGHAGGSLNDDLCLLLFNQRLSLVVTLKRGLVMWKDWWVLDRNLGLKSSLWFHQLCDLSSFPSSSVTCMVCYFV